MASFREQVINCLGQFPEQVSLEPRVLRTESGPGYCRQLVEYQVEQGEWAPAYLLIPEDLQAPTPAVLALHQHAGQFHLGKSEPAGVSKNRMYHYGLELCQRGYVVLCPDHLCFEDRRPPEFKRIEDPRLANANYEKSVAGKLLLEGSTMQAKYLSDLTRAVDYIQSFEFVDPERIGCIGHSLGGRETIWFTWFDPRIKVGVSSCGYSLYRSLLRDQVPQSPTFYVPGLLRIGDIDALVADIAPKPFLLISGKQDEIFPIDGVYEIAQTAERAYAQRGVPERFSSLIFDGMHSFPDEMRQAAYRWLDQWL